MSKKPVMKTTEEKEKNNDGNPNTAFCPLGDNGSGKAGSDVECEDLRRHIRDHHRVLLTSMNKKEKVRVCVSLAKLRRYVDADRSVPFERKRSSDASLGCSGADVVIDPVPARKRRCDVNNMEDGNVEGGDTDTITNVSDKGTHQIDIGKHDSEPNVCNPLLRKPNETPSSSSSFSQMKDQKYEKDAKKQNALSTTTLEEHPPELCTNEAYRRYPDCQTKETTQQSTNSTSSVEQPIIPTTRTLKRPFQRPPRNQDQCPSIKSSLSKSPTDVLPPTPLPQSDQRPVSTHRQSISPQPQQPQPSPEIIQPTSQQQQQQQPSRCTFIQGQLRALNPLPPQPSLGQQRSPSPTKPPQQTSLTLQCQAPPQQEQQQQSQQQISQPPNLQNLIIPKPMVIQEQCELEQKNIDAERRLQLMSPESGITAIDPDRSDFLLRGMVGMENVSQLLWSVIVKPVAASEYYKSTYGKLGPLHFAIVGPHGTGKRTAVTNACSAAAVTAFFVEPHRYRIGDLNFAMTEGWKKRPSVICFDGIEELMERRDFMDEFNMQIVGMPAFLSTWNLMWLAFCAESTAAVTSNPLVRIVGKRIAHVKSMSGPDAADMLMRRYIPSNMAMLEQLTKDQQILLESAAIGCTPSELKEFAANIVLSALSRHNLGDIAIAAGQRVIGRIPTTTTTSAAASGLGTPTRQSTPLSPGIDSGYCGRPPYTKGGKTLYPHEIKEQPPASDDINSPKVYINWNEDAEKLYEEYTDAFGVVKRRIPRFEQRQSDIFIGD